MGSHRAIMNSLPMNAMNETSPTRAADPVSVFMGSTLDTPAGSVAFGGLEKGRESRVEQPSIAKSYCPNIAEPVKDSAPMAGVSDEFRFAAQMAVDMGWMTPQGLEHVMAALDREVNNG